LPSGNIDGVEVLGHLCDGGRFHAAIGVTGIFGLLFDLATGSPIFPRSGEGSAEAATTYRETVLKNVPKLLGLSIAGVVDLQVASLRDNLFCGEGSLGVPPTGITPPCLDLLDLLCEDLVFMVRVHGLVDHVVGRHDESLWGVGLDVQRQSSTKVKDGCWGGI
jgi:hypothetical protein